MKERKDDMFERQVRDELTREELLRKWTLSAQEHESAAKEAEEAGAGEFDGILHQEIAETLRECIQDLLRLKPLMLDC